MNLELILNDTMKIAMQRYSAKLYQSAREGYEHITTDGIFGQAAFVLIAGMQQKAALWAYPTWLERASGYQALDNLMMLPTMMPLKEHWT